MGYSLRYGNDENIKVDIYIYNKGLEDIPEGISAEVIVREYLEALMGIRLMEQVGAYAEVKELGRKIRRYGSRPTPFLWARYEYRQLPVQGAVHEGQRISDTFVTGVRGMFLKVRMTSHEGDSETTEKVFEAFIRELSELIEKEPATPGMRAHDPA